jgi:mono/diheme cytochrome c family protein
VIGKRTLVLLACAASTAGAAVAAGTNKTAGDARRGQAMVERDCNACHARRFDGDASRIYLRADRKVTTPAQLAAQITYCNTELGTGYFPEDEQHIAAYLNERYYHFP